ncbi:MAG: L-threonylcarbamoyladenylate synthase [Chitinispirillaceae bacterium]|nr:L-threonylcarbamoyladenylate synthase [Chitinispirillaceae bacterium]
MTKSERIPLDALLETSSGRKRFERIARTAAEGAVFIYPTETVYGLGGLYGVGGVEERILSVKRSASDKPLICIAPDRSFFLRLPVIFPPVAERLARRFWPGGLTLVLPSSSDIRGIGVRVSSHPFVTEFFRYVDHPLYSTSANLSGEPYVGDPENICAAFSASIDFFIDAGFLRASPPSTIVGIDADETVRIVREGAVAAEDIFKVLR